MKKKSKCHSIYKTQTILFKLFLCALCILSFQYNTFYFYQMLHLDTLQCSYTKSIISLNFIMLIILIHHSLKSCFSIEIVKSQSLHPEPKQTIFHNALSKEHTISKKWKFNCSLLFKIKM